MGFTLSQVITAKQVKSNSVDIPQNGQFPLTAFNLGLEGAINVSAIHIHFVHVAII